MAEEISGEEHRARLAQKRAKSSGPSTKTLGMALAGLLLLGAGFAGGLRYQQLRGTKVAVAATAPSARGQGGLGGRGGFRGQRPVFGQVTAVNSTSITIQAASGSTTTLSVTSATTVSNNGQAATINDVGVGDTVAVVADSTNTTQAARILLSPSFGGGGASSAPGAVTN